MGELYLKNPIIAHVAVYFKQDGTWVNYVEFPKIYSTLRFHKNINIHVHAAIVR